MAKKAVVIVAVVLVVVVVAAAAFFMLSNNSDDNSKKNTYWYYIDYGDYETSTVANGWISGEGNNAYEGICSALDGLGITFDIPDSGLMEGFIIEINGVEPDWSATGDSWSQFVWTGGTDSSISDGWEEMGTGITGVTTSQNIFYFGVTEFDSVTYEPTLDPNTTTGWQDGGPFA
ncbi:MAG: hypothetical protein FWH47_04555 [Methanomassiliicoccaceae archaeon]|nr:hypothetical protein [Methanomassiliicoccaceae archaeon]